ncbi:MAG TPA: hypothetical protein VMB52_07010 [Verrucomicrobiae bacterium]|nr:hypothetical protein [Verrucomicrobiae bacterium]
MQVSRYGGYEFRPPIEVGDHIADSLPKLVALALMGATMSDEVLAMGAQQGEVALSKAQGNELAVLSSMLEGKHTVTAL